MKTSALIAAAFGLAMNNEPTQAWRMPSPKRTRKYPVPQCSSPEAIAAWNASVSTRQVRRATAHARGLTHRAGK